MCSIWYKYERISIEIYNFSGAFPLSDVSLMTDAEREQFLPITKNFINILEKDTVTQNEIDLLVEQSEELSELIPEKFRDVITQSINDQFNS